MSDVSRKSRNKYQSCCWRIGTIYLCLLLLCIIFVQVPATCEVSTRKSGKVLVFHSYNYGYTWTDGLNSSFVNEMKSYPEISYTIDYLDLKRHVGETYVNGLIQILKVKYSGLHYDAIVVSDDPGFDLSVKLRDSLFPNAPIVFCGLNNFDPDRAVQIGNVTGVIEELSINETLDLVKTLHPDRAKIIWVGDDFSKTEKYNTGLFKDFIKNYKSDFQFEFWMNLTEDELVNKLDHLDNSSVMITSFLMKTRTGEIITAERSTKILCEHSKCPVYSFWDFHMGYGVVGGKVTSSENQGKIAAQMAAKIVNGYQTEDIPINASKEANLYLFDYNALERFNINDNLLPPQSTILFQPFSFYKTYRIQIWIVICTIVTLVVIVIFLYLNMVARKIANKLLTAQKDFLKSMLVNLPIDFWARNKDGVVIAQSELSKQLWGDYLGSTLDNSKDDSMLSNELLKNIEYAYQGETAYLNRNIVVRSESYYFHTVIAPIVSSSQVIGILGINQDLTSMKNAEIEITKKSEELAMLNKNLEIQINETQQLNSNLRQSQAELLISNKTIRDSEKKFKNLIENMSEGYATINLSGQFVFSNPAADFIFDCNLGDLVNQNLSQYFLSQDCEAIISEATKEIEHRPSHLVATVTTHRKETKTLLISIAPTQGEYSHEPGANIIFIDITERIAAEKAAFENETKLQSIISQIKAQIWATDAQLRVTYFLGSSFKTKSDYYEALVGKLVSDVMPKDEYNSELFNAHKNALNGQSYSRTLVKDSKAYEFIIEPRRDKDGVICGVIGFAFDKTELTQAREKIATIDIQLRQAQKISKLGSWIYDIKSNQIFATEMLNEMLGFENNKVLSIEDFISFICPEDVSRFNGNLFKMVSKITQDSNNEYKLNIGENKVDVLIQARSIFNESGEVVKLIGSLQDITERRQLEEDRLKMRNLETLSTLASGIAHDFNNYLTVIGTHADEVLAELNQYNNLDIIESLKTIKRFVKTSTGLTQQLLTFARGSKPVKKIVNLSSLVLTAAQFAAHGSSLQIEYEIPKDYYINADENQIGGQVINNLVINAKQARATQLYISLRSFVNPITQSEFVEVKFTDNGSGIDKSLIKRIFDPYFTTKREGSGLGLAICQNILSNHDGDIFIQNTSSEGTTFICILPLIKETARTTEPTPEIVSDIPKVRILIMDDEETVRYVLARMLTKLGHDVIITTNEVEAIEAYQQAFNAGSPPDISILDLTLVGRPATGEDVLRAIRQINPSAKVVVSSGYAYQLEASPELSFDASLNKPYYIDDLAKIIQQMQLNDHRND